jgi:hypothetical protein
MKEEKLRKLTFGEVMNRYEEMVNDEYDFSSFSSYYVTDNDCDGAKEKPYKLKSLWLTPISPHSKNGNNKYVLSEEQKAIFKNKLIETFNKENIYLL